MNTASSTAFLLDWRLLGVLGLPLLLLCALLFLAQMEQSTDKLFEEQRFALQTDAERILALQRNWADEASFAQTLENSSLWSQAYIQEGDSLRVWQQSRPVQQQNWPALPQVKVALNAHQQLVLHSRNYSPEQISRLHAVLLTHALSAALIWLLLCAISYYLCTRPINAIQRWLHALEHGRLDEPAPIRTGALGGISKNVEVLAQRLRFSRDTLQQHSQLNQQRNDGQLSSLGEELNQLREDYQRLQSLLSSRSEFMSSMGHELRTPLTAIMGFSDLLEKSELSQEQADYVQTIRKSAKGLVGMINDLLDFGRMEAGRLEIHEVGFDVSDCVEDTIALLAPLAYEKNLELISIIYHDVPLKLRGDPVRLQQILTNLISNAIKFTERGQVLVRVMRETEDDGKIFLRLQIEDTGVGLSKDQQAQLFTAFQRFEDKKGQVAQGSGLGLTIVKKLTDLLSGRIEVSSEVGQGSSFSAILPFAEPVHTMMRPNWDALRACRCWVLEPHDTANRALQHLLEFWGMQSRSFDTASDLLGSLGSAKQDKLPDLILLGLRADESSEAVICDILRLARDTKTPVCCRVNSVDATLHRQLKDQGAGAVLPKASNRSTLYRTCYELLGQSSPSREQSNPLQGQKILIAENNLASQRYLGALLSSLGAETELADDGDQAIASWQNHQPTIALLDLHMPGRDGRQTAAAIRDADPQGDTVLIGMSAWLSKEEEHDWLDAGVNAILLKPFDESQLLRCLQPWLKSRSPAQENPESASAQKLVTDPQLVDLMQEELPKQLDELDQAFIQGDLVAARSAAHQLHGTAAFFHLQPLKEHVFLMEKRLKEVKDIASHPRLRDDMANVRQAVQATMDDLQA